MHWSSASMVSTQSVEHTAKENTVAAAQCNWLKNDNRTIVICYKQSTFTKHMAVLVKKVQKRKQKTKNCSRNYTTLNILKLR